MDGDTIERLKTARKDQLGNKQHIIFLLPMPAYLRFGHPELWGTNISVG